MNTSQPAPKRLDLSTFEMIFVVVLISLHDFLLSDALSLPFALRHSTLLQFRSWDRVMSGLEYLVPIIIFVAMILLCMHLYHGLWSMFQSMGINHPRYTPMLKRAAAVVAILIAIGNISIPISVMLGIVK